MGLKTEKETPAVAPSSRQDLSHSEEQSLDRTIGDLNKQIDKTEISQGLNHAAPNKENVQKRIAELRRIRETRSVRKAVGREREQVEMEIKKLTEELQKGMPTWKEYSFTRKKDGPVYNQLKQWIIGSETNPLRKQRIARWKYLKRRLDPTDPYIASTTRLFPKTSQLETYY